MELPRPCPTHARLMRFAGSWRGDERLPPSPWGPGGPVIGRSVCRPSLDGMA